MEVDMEVVEILSNMNKYIRCELKRRARKTQKLRKYFVYVGHYRTPGACDSHKKKHQRCPILCANRKRR